MKKLIATAALLAGSAFADTLTYLSGDASSYTSQGTLAAVTPVPSSECPYCWPDFGAPWESIYDSGWGTGGADLPQGYYSVFQPFTITSLSHANLISAGDDSDESFLIRLVGNKTLTTDLGYGDFATPLQAEFDLIAGNYILETQVRNSHSWAAGTGNYGGFADKLDIANGPMSRTPEPSTLASLLSGAALLWVGMRRRK